MKKRKKILIAIIVACVIGGIALGTHQVIIKHVKTLYTDKDFGYKSIRSGKNHNKNKIDDTMDLVYGARKEAQRHPAYRSKYYVGGYPPSSEGVCTDVIWRAFKEAGVNLKKLVDADIKKHRSRYKRVGTIDPNIDFRRVPNLKVFFHYHAENLTKDISKKEQWQAGDIVVFANSHISIISNYRDKKGYPLLLHHASKKQKNLEADVLVLANSKKKITGHYRYLFP